MVRTKSKLIVQFIEYLISGGAYFWVGYLILDFLYYKSHWSLWWATIVSNVIGWTVNFILQRYWVFSNQNLKGHKTEVTTRYAAITLVDFVLNYEILNMLNKFGITPAIGQFFSAGFFTIWNYLWYRFWVFPEKLKKITPHARPIANRPHGHGAYYKV